MGFEIFTKMTRVATEPKISIGKKLGRFQFNAAAAKILADNAVDNVLMMWDKENHIVGIKGISKKDQRAYSLRFAKKGNGAGFAAKAFLHHISYDLSQTRSFEGAWDEEQNMFVIPIPDNAFKVTESTIRPSKLPIRGIRAENEGKGHAKASA